MWARVTCGVQALDVTDATGRTIVSREWRSPTKGSSGWEVQHFAALSLCNCITLSAVVYSTAILPYCCTAILLCCHTAILPYCHTAILPYCHTTMLPYCYAAILLYCCTAILLYCCTAMSAATYHPGCVQDVAWRGDGGQQTSGRRLTDYRHTQRPEVLPAATVPGCLVTVCCRA